MEKLNFCLDCKRIFSPSQECSYCKSNNIKELGEKAPVNVIGSKLKGRVLKVSQGIARVIVIDEKKNSSIKEFEVSKIRKVL